MRTTIGRGDCYSSEISDASAYYSKVSNDCSKASGHYSYSYRSQVSRDGSKASGDYSYRSIIDGDYSYCSKVSRDGHYCPTIGAISDDSSYCLKICKDDSKVSRDGHCCSKDSTGAFYSSANSGEGSHSSISVGGSSDSTFSTDRLFHSPIVENRSLDSTIRVGKRKRSTESVDNVDIKKIEDESNYHPK